MSEVDAAHVLFPNDAPAGSSRAPEWWVADRTAAEHRLRGIGHAPAPDRDPTAAALFPSEVSAKPEATAGNNGDDPERALFPKDVAAFDEKGLRSFMDGFRLSAIGEGDRDRADALGQAADALAADFAHAGTDHADLQEALSVIHERQADTLVDVPLERIEAERVAGMAALAAEGITDAELNAARAFVADLEKIAPGTKLSLERTGAGNDLRLIRKAISEAKRRGYR